MGRSVPPAGGSPDGKDQTTESRSQAGPFSRRKGRRVRRQEESRAGPVRSTRASERRHSPPNRRGTAGGGRPAQDGRGAPSRRPRRGAHHAFQPGPEAPLHVVPQSQPAARPIVDHRQDRRRPLPAGTGPPADGSEAPRDADGQGSPRSDADDRRGPGPLVRHEHRAPARREGRRRGADLRGGGHHRAQAGRDAHRRPGQVPRREPGPGPARVGGRDAALCERGRRRPARRLEDDGGQAHPEGLGRARPPGGEVAGAPGGGVRTPRRRPGPADRPRPREELRQPLRPRRHDEPPGRNPDAPGEGGMGADVQHRARPHRHPRHPPPGPARQPGDGRPAGRDLRGGRGKALPRGGPRTPGAARLLPPRHHLRRREAARRRGPRGRARRGLPRQHDAAARREGPPHRQRPRRAQHHPAQEARVGAGASRPHPHGALPRGSGARPRRHREGIPRRGLPHRRGGLRPRDGVDRLRRTRRGEVDPPRRVGRIRRRLPRHAESHLGGCAAGTRADGRRRPHRKALRLREHAHRPELRPVARGGAEARLRVKPRPAAPVWKQGHRRNHDLLPPAGRGVRRRTPPA